jgi:hypothetical protein
MSGSNTNMTLVTTVTKSLNGSNPALTPYTWTCPTVDPYSVIYFYSVGLESERAPGLCLPTPYGVVREWGRRRRCRMDDAIYCELEAVALILSS